MWEFVVTGTHKKNLEVIQSYLINGYEPFAISTDERGEKIWLKREIPDIVETKEGYRERTREEKLHAFRKQRPEPDKGASSKPASKPKKKDSS